MLITEPIEDNETLRTTGQALRFDTSQLASASFDDVTLKSPLSSIQRIVEINQAKTRGEEAKPGANLAKVTQQITSGDVEGADAIFEVAKAGKREIENLLGFNPDANFLTADEWKDSEYFRKGLKFPEGVQESVAQIIADRKDDENFRKLVLSRGRGGFGETAATFSAGIAASLLDPINVASAFIPIVGAARFTILTGKLGLTGARATKGVIEGAVGAALVEPIVLAAAIQEQADYNSLDSLLNITFGGILGGGLHVAGGKVIDIARRTSIPDRELKLRTAIAHAQEGKSVNIGPIDDTGTRVDMHPTENRPLTPDELDASKFKQKAREIITGTKKQNAKSVEPEIDIVPEIQRIIDTPEFLRSATDKLTLKALDKTPELQQLVKALETPAFLRTADDKLTIRRYSTDTANIQDMRPAEAQKELDAVNADIDKVKSTITKTERGAKTKATRLKNLEETRAALIGELKKGDINKGSILREIDRQQTPEADSLFDPSASKRADEVLFSDDLKDTKGNGSTLKELEREVNAVDEEIQALQKSGYFDEEEVKALKAADQTIKDADKIAEALNAIARCRL